MADLGELWQTLDFVSKSMECQIGQNATFCFQLSKIISDQGRIESVGREGMQLQCSVLKHQNSYEFIHDLKNSNNIHEFTGVYQLKWHHSLLERLLTKKLLKTKVQVSSKEICNMAIKDRVVAVIDGDPP